MPAGIHRNRVAVRSYVTNLVLRMITEREAWEMCDEDSHGERLYLREPEAYRLSRKKAPLRDIRLRAPLRAETNSQTTLTCRDTENNAFAKSFTILGGSEISIHALTRSEIKVEVWASVHDDRAIVICAGKVYRPAV